MVNAVTKDLVFATVGSRFIYNLYWFLARFLPGATAYTRLQTLGADRHASAVVHCRQYVKALYRIKLLVSMLLFDYSKHSQDKLKLYSVHSFADGVRIILTIAFPFVKSFKFNIVYNSNFGRLRYVGFRSQIAVLTWLGLPPYSSA